MDLLALSSIFFTIGIVIFVVFIFRRTSNKIFDSTKYNYLRLTGVMGEATLLSLTDTGKTLADVYTIMDAEIELKNINPIIRTKTQVALLKSQIPTIGNTVKVKYDPKDPKVAMIIA